jgi:hypothetical protein
LKGATRDKDEEIVQLNQSIQQLSNIETKSAKSSHLAKDTSFAARLSPVNRTMILNENK